MRVQFELPQKAIPILAKVIAGAGLILALDAVWLTLAFRHTSLYSPLVAGRGPVPTSRIAGLMVAYALMISSFLALHKASSTATAALYGGVVGIVVFGTFNLTTAAIDIAWGGAGFAADVLYGTVALAAVAAAQHAVGSSFKI